jgi:transposase-like protein
LDSRLATRQLDSAALERSYLERQSLRATGRIFGISHVTVFQHLKKKRARR